MKTKTLENNYPLSTINSKLPKGWEKQRLEDCFRLKSGDGLTSKMMSEDGEYPVFGGNGIAGLHNEYNLSGSNVIIGRVGALCGNVRHMNENIWLTDNAFKITDFKFDFDHSFLTYLLNFKNLRGFARQAAQPVISNSSLKDVILEFPKPLPEQQRIVSILDECFEVIERSRNAAIKNIKNAKELFESYLQGVCENKGDGWEEKTLDEVCEFRNGAAHERHIDDDGGYILINSKFISSDGEKVKRTNSALSPLFIGDIAFVMSDVPNGRALAKCFLVDQNDTYTLNQRIGAIKSKAFIPEFLVYQYNRNKDLLSFNNGENQTNLRKGDILKCPLFVPSKEEQQTIVRQLDALRAETQKLEAVYQKKIDDLEELKKSILQKAFAGELRGGEACRTKKRKKN